MPRILALGEKPLDWIGSAKRDLLHAFQKKSPRGVKTAQADIEMVERRLKLARRDYEARYGTEKR